MAIHPTEIAVAALLKSPQGKMLELGEAIISTENQTVDFCSEFVQLFKMDTPLQIVLLKDEHETQRISGRVYLSSQSMLRLVGVSDEILPGAKMAYMCSSNLTGTLRASITEEIREGFFNIQRKTITSEQYFPVRVHNLSMQNVFFTSEKKLDKGQFTHLQLMEPPVKDMLLEVEKVLDFGQSVSNYHCRIKELRPAARLNLDNYITRLCEEQYKLF